MKKIHFTYEEIQQLPLIQKTNESLLLKYSEKEIIKHFYRCDSKQKRTLELMDQYYKELNQIKSFLLHKKEVYVDGNLEGILMDKGYSSNLEEYVKNSSPNVENKIYILKEIGKVLHQLHILRTNENILTDFFIGDLHEGNILIDEKTKKIQFIDLNHCKIGDNYIFDSRYIQFFYAFGYVYHYLKEKYPRTYNFIPNENTDLFCYHVMIAKIIYNIDIRHLNLTQFYQTILELKNKKMMPESLYQSFCLLYQTCDNKNPYSYLEDISPKLELNH